MTDEKLLLAIDTASDMAGVALLAGESIVAESTWRSRQSHSRQLLPTLEWLLERAGFDKTHIGAIAVCLGPGSYAGMRVGVTAAKTLAYALDVPIVGVGRLEADALPVASMTEGRVVALHAAGRAEIAWAAYRSTSPLPFGHPISAGGEGDGGRGISDGLQELVAPHLTPRDAFVPELQAGDVVVAELATLGDELIDAIERAGHKLLEANATRVVAVGLLAARRLARGEIDNADTLVPLYLRAPAIGPQS